MARQPKLNSARSSRRDAQEDTSVIIGSFTRRPIEFRFNWTEFHKLAFGSGELHATRRVSQTLRRADSATFT